MQHKIIMCKTAIFKKNICVMPKTREIPRNVIRNVCKTPLSLKNTYTRRQCREQECYPVVSCSSLAASSAGGVSEGGGS